MSEYTTGNEFPLICAFSYFQAFWPFQAVRVGLSPPVAQLPAGYRNLIGGNIFLFQRTTFRLCSRQALEINPSARLRTGLSATLYILYSAVYIASEFFPQYLSLQDFLQRYNRHLMVCIPWGIQTLQICLFSYGLAGIQK